MRGLREVVENEGVANRGSPASGDDDLSGVLGRD